MKKTANYQLNQWEAEDRILHGDFNADNSKIDAAIRAVDSARASGDQALSSRIASEAARLENLSDCKLLHTQNVTADSVSVTVPLSSVDWSKYKLVFVLLDGGQHEGFVRLNNRGDTSSQMLSNLTMENLARKGSGYAGMFTNFSPWLYVFFPFQRPSTAALCLSMGEGLMIARGGITYSELNYLTLAAADASYPITAGTHIEVWGVQ